MPAVLYMFAPSNKNLVVSFYWLKHKNLVVSFYWLKHKNLVKSRDVVNRGNVDRHNALLS